MRTPHDFLGKDQHRTPQHGRCVLWRAPRRTRRGAHGGFGLLVVWILLVLLLAPAIFSARRHVSKPLSHRDPFYLFEPMYYPRNALHLGLPFIHLVSHTETPSFHIYTYSGFRLNRTHLAITPRGSMAPIEAKDLSGIVFRIQPRRAVIVVNGIHIGEVWQYTPRDRRPLLVQSGLHTITIQKKGWEPATIELEILPDTIVMLRGRLQKHAPAQGPRKN